MEFDEDVAVVLKDLCEDIASKSTTTKGSLYLTSGAVSTLTKHVVDYNYDLTEKGYKHLKQCGQWNEVSRCFEGTSGPIQFLSTLDRISKPLFGSETDEDDPNEQSVADTDEDPTENASNEQESVPKKARHAEREPSAEEGRVHQPKHTEKQHDIVFSVDVQRQNHKYVVDQFVSEGKLDLYEASYDTMAEELKFAYGPLGHIVKLAGRGRTSLLVDIVKRYWTRNLHPLFDIQPSLCGLESICNNILYAAIYANNKSMIRDIALLCGPFEFVREYKLDLKPKFAWGIVIEPNADALHEYVRIVKEHRPEELPNVTAALRTKLSTREPHHKPLILDLLKQIEESTVAPLVSDLLKQSEEPE